MKVELIIPSDLSEISLKQYQKFLKIQRKPMMMSYFLQCKDDRNILGNAGCKKVQGY